MRHLRRNLVVPILFATVAARSSQADGLAGPVLGYVPESSAHAVQVIRGLPGSSTWGDPVRFGDSVTRIAAFPRQNNALVFESGGVRVGVLGGEASGTQSDFLVPGDLSAAPVAFSSTSGNAVLYDQAARALRLIGLRPGDAPVSRTVDASMLAGPTAILAVSDGDDPLIAGVLADDATAVFVLDTAGNYRVVSGFSKVTSLAFVATTKDLAVGDRGTQQISLMRDPLSGRSPEGLFLLPDSSDGPTAMASSADGKALGVLSGGSVELFQFADSSLNNVDCACGATALEPLNGNAVFRVTDSLGKPLWLVDAADATQVKIVFVPALHPSPGEQQ